MLQGQVGEIHLFFALFLVGLVRIGGGGAAALAVVVVLRLVHGPLLREVLLGFRLILGEVLRVAFTPGQPVVELLLIIG